MPRTELASEAHRALKALKKARGTVEAPGDMSNTALTSGG